MHALVWGPAFVDDPACLFYALIVYPDFLDLIAFTAAGS